MSEFESGEILHDSLINTISDAYINNDTDTFKYASELFDELKDEATALSIAKEALANLAKKYTNRGMLRDRTEAPIIERVEFPDQIEINQFEDFPNRRHSLKGIDHNGQLVLLNRTIAKKLYRCKECQEDIPIGSEHVVMGIVQASKRYDHHHLHSPCVQDKVLPNLHHIEIAKPWQTSATERNKKSRRLRYNSKK